MKTISVYALVTTVLLVIIVGCSSGGGESSFRVGYDFGALDKIAIVAVEGSVKSDQARDQVADIFAMELLRKGYAPVGRAQVKALLRERELESADLTTVEAATEAGLILDVPVVLVIDIPHFGKETSMTAKMINVEDGSILWMGRGSAETKGILGAISGLFRLEEVDTGTGISGQEDEVLSGVPGDILGDPVEPAGIRPAFGGPVGGVLSPKEAKKMQEIIETMCKSLPARPVN
ncbi:MAG: hypothetical protein ACYS9C_13225 [Planctomycetota bacterium]|jgi:hypothetical protein